MENPAVECFADAGALVGGKVGKWIGEVIQMALLVFIMGAHILTFSVMMNTTTIHASCTIWWTLIALGVSIAATLPKTFKTNSYISIFCTYHLTDATRCKLINGEACMSIIVATFIALVSLAVDKPGLGNSYTFTPLALTSIGQGSVAAGNIVLAFSGHIAYFNIMTEMKNPREFKKALTAAQVTSIVIYLVVGLVIYYYAGQDVASPAINSVRLVVRKASYALATPTIVIAGVITALVASKTMHRHIKQRGPLAKIDEETKGWLSWTVIVVSLWVVAWLIANIIPGFAQLLALIGALFGTWISLGLPAIFWLWMNRRCYGLKWGDRVQKPSKPNWRKKSLAVVNVCILWLCIGMVSVDCFFTSLDY